jgi:hypothetical protein
VGDYKNKCIFANCSLTGRLYEIIPDIADTVALECLGAFAGTEPVGGEFPYLTK